jgi:hypothetical protein
MTDSVRCSAISNADSKAAVKALAGQDQHDRIPICLSDAHQSRENCGSRAFVERLHDSLRWPVGQIAKIVVLVRSREGEQDLLCRDASFRALSGIFQ